MQEQALSPTAFSSTSSPLPARAAWCPWTLGSLLVTPLLVLLLLVREADRAEPQATRVATEAIGRVAPTLPVAASPLMENRLIDVGLAAPPISPRIPHQSAVGRLDCLPQQAPLDLRREHPAKAASGSTSLDQTSLERPASIKDTPRRRAPAATSSAHKAALPVWQFKR